MAKQLELDGGVASLDLDECSIFPKAAGATAAGRLAPPFRPIHYLGSKQRLLPEIRAVIDELDPAGGRLCDLFSGSGSVAGYIGQERPVTAIDVQEYARVVCSALLRPVHFSPGDLVKAVEEVQASAEAKALNWAFQPLINYEVRCCGDAEEGNLEGLCDLLENGSLFVSSVSSQGTQRPELREACFASRKRLDEVGLSGSVSSVISQYYGGVYFSYQQAVDLDVLASMAHTHYGEKRDTLLAALLSAASNIVNTVGKQFAQPLRPRDVQGKPKASILKKANSDRARSVWREYLAAASKISARRMPDLGHSVLRGDYTEALSRPSESFGVVYADPPYTRDHYSRFYHVLETIALRDRPEIVSITRNGLKRLSRGIYRAERYQSPFCIRSAAPDAFHNLFGRVGELGAPLVLSYSPHEKEDGTHPRVVSLSSLVDLAGQHFRDVEVRDVSGVTHSYLNHSRRRLELRKSAEVLILCRP